MNNLNITDKETLINDFINFIKNSDNFKEEPTPVKNSKKLNNPKWYLYCDIETFRFNLDEAELNSPSDAKNATWIVQVAYFESDDDMPNWCYFKDFREFLNIITQNKCKELENYDIVLVFHNGFKYDCLFLQKELQHSLHVQLYNIIDEKSTDKDFLKDIKDNEIKTVPNNYKEKDHDYVTVSAVRASTQHMLTFSYKGLYFVTEDSYLKTNDSLEMIGKKCLDKGFLTKDFIKDKSDIDFKDEKYNIRGDLDDTQIETRKAILLGDLSEREFKYVRNDVVVLAMCHKHFPDLYYGFSWKEFTFSGNVKKEYEKKGYYKTLTNFQLTKKTPERLNYYNQYKENKDKRPKNLTLADKEFPDPTYESAEKFFRQFYRGGLNMYNERYVGEIIEPEKAGFSMDLNSSYPTVMYTEKLPTYLVQAFHYGRLKRLTKEFKDQNYFYMLTIKPKAMDNLLKHVKSRVIKQMFIKYYTVRNDGYVFINSVALILLEQFMTKKIENLSFKDCYKWKCEDFGARNVIRDNYYIKQHGKSDFEFKNIINKQPFDPLHIEVDKTVRNLNKKSDDEVQASKVLLNGIYGIPAMRPSFPQFVYREDGSYVSCGTGHKNKERNVIFSVGVTAFAFRNLIKPLTFLTPEEIDKYFWYCDTDSLYFDGAVRDKIVKEHKEIFDPNNLGCWDLEHKNIVKFYVLNHKKYALYDTNDKKPLTMHAGGVPKETFKKWCDECMTVCNDSEALNLLKDKYFHQGAEIIVTRSILTKYGTVDIYQGKSTLQDGLHDGKKTKHYINTYQECKNVVEEQINMVGEHFNNYVEDFDEYFSDINADSSKSIQAEMIVKGYPMYLSYDGLIETKKYYNEKQKQKQKSKKKEKVDINRLMECDNKLIQLYRTWRTPIDWQNERLQALEKPKTFKNLKDYFGCEYLAKEIANGVYLTYDLRVIRKKDLFEYSIDRINMVTRFNNKPYYIFTEYVRLFFDFTLEGNVNTIEKFLDKLVCDALTPKELENFALYSDMKVQGKGYRFTDPENERYKKKKEKGFRVADIREIYEFTWSEGIKDRIYHYIKYHNDLKNEKKDPKNEKKELKNGK